VTATYTTGPTGQPAIPVAPGAQLYTYSDMTGAQLRTITTRAGHWIQNFDAGYPRADWFRVSWVENVPPGSSVEALVRTADAVADLTGSTWSCGPLTAPPFDLSGCPQLNGHRYAAVELVLRSTVDGVRPSARDIAVEWSRP
jgi:hypothetical protein